MEHSNMKNMNKLVEWKPFVDSKASEFKDEFLL